MLEQKVSKIYPLKARITNSGKVRLRLKYLKYTLLDFGQEFLTSQNIGQLATREVIVVSKSVLSAYLTSLPKETNGGKVVH